MSLTTDKLTSTMNPGLPFGRVPPNPYTSDDSDDQLHTMMQMLLLPAVIINMPGINAISFARRPHASTRSLRPEAITYQRLPHGRSS